MRPKTLLQQRDAVLAFHDAYVEYLEAHGGSHDLDALRRRVISLLPMAAFGLRTARTEMAIYPSGISGGGPVIRGLQNVAFVHEKPGFRLQGPQMIQQVIDTCQLAAAKLEAEADEQRQVRRNPLYWGDRLLRTVLGIPAYLISLIFRVPVQRIEESPWGTVLRVVSLGVEVVAVYLGGREAGWWS